MRTLKRKVSVRPLPSGAEIKERRRKATIKELQLNPSQATVLEQIATWKSRGGEKQQGVVIESPDGTRKVRVRSPIWTAKYRDANGVINEVSTGCRDKQAAQNVLNQLASRAEKVAAGVLSLEEVDIAKHQHVPLTQHILDYLESLRERGRNQDRIKTSGTYLTNDATACGFKYLRDLSATKLRKWLNSQNEMSAATYNWHSEIWTAFGWWLCGKRLEGKRPVLNGEKRLSSNPFDGFGKKDVESDRKRRARAMTSPELARLVDAARRRPLEDALTVRSGANKGQQIARVSDATRDKLERLGQERALIYKSLVLTGLRANELRTLLVRDLSFGDLPFLKLSKSNEKNRKGSTIPLREDLATELKRWVEGKERSDRVFNVPRGILRIMNRDLKLANIPKVDEDGYVVHIHALRHSFGTHLSAAGVAPRVAQAAMRHSDIKLTMNTYTDARLLDTASAVNSLELFRSDDTSSPVSDSGAPPAAPNSVHAMPLESFPDYIEVEDNESNETENPEKTRDLQGLSIVGATRRQ